VDERVLGFARHSERKVAVREGLEGEALELVIAHELIHLAAPDTPFCCILRTLKRADPKNPKVQYNGS